MAISSTLIRENRGELRNLQFREIAEKHLKHFTVSTQQVKEVPRALQIRYKGDFYGLLKEQGINYDYWWFIMRFNQMHSPCDYQGTPVYLYPNEGDITSLLRNWNNTYTR